MWSFDRAALVLFLLTVVLVASAPLIRNLQVDTNFAKLLARDGEGVPGLVDAASSVGGRTPLLVSFTAGEGSGADLGRVSGRFAVLIGEWDDVSLLSGRIGGQGDPLLDGILLNAALLNQDPPLHRQLMSRLHPPEMERQIRRARRRLATVDDAQLREVLATDVLGAFELARPFMEARLGDRGRALFGGSPSPTGSALLWLIPHGRADDSRYCVDLIARLDEIARQAASGPDLHRVKISFSGLHAMTAESTTKLRSDLLLITASASGLLLVLLLVVLRRVSLVGLCFLPLAASVVLLLDAAALLFNPIYFVTIGFVAIVLGLGLDVAVHLAGRFSARLETSSPRDAIGSTVQEVGLPLAAGVLSTAGAFLALLITGRAALVEFGLLTAAGLLLTLVTTLVVFPALARYLVPAETRRSEGCVRSLSGHFEFFDRRRRGCFAAGLALVVLSLPWAARFRWHMDPLDFFAGRSGSVETTRAAEASTGMALTSAFHIDIEAPAAGPAIEALRMIDRELEQAVRDGSVFSFESPSMLVPYEPNPRQGDSAGSLDHTAFFDLLDRFGIRRTNEHDRYLEILDHLATLPTAPSELLDLLPDQLGNLVDTSSDRVTFRITVWPASSATAGELFSSRPAAEAASTLAGLELPDDVRVAVLGTAGVLDDIQRTAGSSFVSVGALALILVLGVLWVAFLDVTSVSLSLLPLIGALPVMLAGVVLLEIPVTPTAIAFGAIVLGVGIDDAVHMVFLSGPPIGRGVPEVLAEVGPVVTLTTVSTMIGFGCLMWSSHPVVSSLGGAVVLGVAGAWLFTMLLVPTLLHHRYRRRGVGTAAGVLLMVAVLPQPVRAQSDDAGQLLSRLHRRAASANAVSCEFRQVKILSQLEKPVETQGSLLFSPPDRLRVEVRGELNLLLLVDGRQLTVVDLDLVEVERISMDDIGGRAAALGPFSVLVDLDPEEVEERFFVQLQRNEGELDVLVLHPRRESSETREIRLAVDKRLRTRRIEWLFENGDSVVTELNDWRRRSHVADELFVFTGEGQWETVR